MTAADQAPATDSEHVWVSQGEDGVSTDCARCGIWYGKTHDGHQCPGTPQTDDGALRAARAQRITIAATDSERGERLGAEAVADLTAMIGGGQADSLYMPMGMAVALLSKVTRLTILVDEQDATIDLLTDAIEGARAELLDAGPECVNDAVTILTAALGSQQTEGDHG